MLQNKAPKLLFFVTPKPAPALKKVPNVTVLQKKAPINYI